MELRRAATRDDDAGHALRQPLRRGGLRREAGVELAEIRAKPRPAAMSTPWATILEATRLVSIPTQRVLLGVYVMASVFYGIASLLSVARTGVGDPNTGQTASPGLVLLGNSLGKSIIAEGIETAEQMERLRGMGCRAGQGFFLSRPLTADMVDTLLDGLVAPPHVASQRRCSPDG